MKISFIMPHLNVGGAERTVTYLSEYFATKGNNVSIVCFSNEIMYEITPKVDLKILNISYRAKNIFQRIYNGIKRYVETFRYYNKEKPDVIISLLPEVARYVVWFCRIKNIKIITSERNNPKIDGDFNLKKRLLKKSDGIIFQTARAKEQYSDYIQNKSTVIPNAIGNKLVYECKIEGKREKKIVAVGRLNEQKDYPTLIKAFHIVLKRYPDYILEIYGIGNEEKKLKQIVEELNIEKNIKFCGLHMDAILKICNAACYVMSSIYEGMPNALMEAMAVGLPCVSTDCPNGPAELIENYKNGILVPIKDFKALADAIIKMISDKDLSNRCSENAIKIRETNSINVISERYLKYIYKVCGE